MQLFDRQGKRLYLSAEERAAFMEVPRKAAPDVRTCAPSCMMPLPGERAAGADLTGGWLVLRTLKKRRQGLYRAVPVPPATLFDHIDLVHRVREAQNIAGAFVTTYLGQGVG